MKTRCIVILENCYLFNERMNVSLTEKNQRTVPKRLVMVHTRKICQISRQKCTLMYGNTYLLSLIKWIQLLLFLYKAEIQGAFESFCDKMLLLWDS